MDFVERPWIRPLGVVQADDPNVSGFLASHPVRTRKMKTGAGFGPDVLFVVGVRRKCRFQKNASPDLDL